MNKLNKNTLTKILLLGIIILFIGLLYNNKENFDMPSNINRNYYILCNNKLLLNESSIVKGTENTYDVLLVNPLNRTYIDPPTKPNNRYIWSISDGTEPETKIIKCLNRTLATIKTNNGFKLCMVINTNNLAEQDYNFKITLNKNSQSCKLNSNKFSNANFLQNVKDNTPDLYNINNNLNANSIEAEFNFIPL